MRLNKILAFLKIKSKDFTYLMGWANPWADGLKAIVKRSGLGDDIKVSPYMHDPMAYLHLPNKFRLDVVGENGTLYISARSATFWTDKPWGAWLIDGKACDYVEAHSRKGFINALRIAYENAKHHKEYHPIPPEKYVTGIFE